MNEIDPSLRHVPKLADVPEGCEPVYRCQLCRREGTREQLLGEECQARSGVIKRVVLEESGRFKRKT